MASSLTSTLDLGAALLAGDPDPGFLPCPKISLYVDPSLLGSCGICHGKLEFRSCSNSSRQEDEDLAAATTTTTTTLLMASDAEVAMVPCGHLACYACMTQCLECRVSTNKLASEVILKSLAEDWERLRGQYQKGAGELAKMAMRHKVRISQQSFQLLTDRLSDHVVAAMGMQW